MTKLNSILLVTIVILYSSILANAQQVRVDKIKAGVTFSETNKAVYLPHYHGPDIQLQQDFVFGPNYIIGPEILVGGGYYDWQSNGASMHQIAWINDSIMHAIYMTNADSTVPPGTPLRRTIYYFSDNGGANWLDIVAVPPTTRSGFGTLAVGTTGASQDVAIIGNHYITSELTAGMHVDLIPGVGNFVSTPWPIIPTNFVWPIISTLTNGNVLVSGNTYQSGNATDTGTTVVFNPVTNAWIASTFKTFVSPATSHLNMRWTTATGPDGKGIYVIDPIQDAGGSFGGNRIFYYTTTDNGVTWSNQNLLFDTFIDEYNDTVNAWLALDAVYDNSGNFYVTFNSTADSFQASSLWASKNGQTPVRVVRNSQIPGAMWSILNSQGNMCGLDWPAINVSDDGQYIFIVYTVPMQDDTLNNFNSCNIYYSFSQTGTLNFTDNGPIQVTSGINDERYPSLHRKALTQGPDTYVLHLVYQKDPQGGSFAFNDNAPISRASLIYRKITQAHIIGVQDPSSGIAKEYTLGQNYPNPFNPTTKIGYNLLKTGFVTLKVFDILGREVETIINTVQNAGYKEIEFNAVNLPSGVYFYTLNVEDRSGLGQNFSDTKKMVILK